MHAENLSYCETARRFETTDRSVCAWAQIYLEHGPEGLYLERQNRTDAASGTRKPKKPKLSEKARKDLIAENAYLRAENDYLKNLHALVSKRAQRENGQK
jgi:transposase-like protein